LQKLEALPKPKMEIASMPHNKGKCRYKLLYPGKYFHNVRSMQSKHLF